MSYDEPLVGSLAVVFAVASSVVAVGPWAGPYRLRSIAAVEHRFGKLAARCLWLAVAIAAFAAGIAILSGVRPSYVEPVEHHSVE
ncbi:hypothetical protein Pla52o_46990 [Novipirellula galeiformis]|uniref:Uncharacterized protein n=1 Tax=Novipirellula galeiformis TaxID=2528004 RepID=A0A5C6C9V4_9BACT|nr:hypothetical protein [Novipirellula galeiformis]TWU20184.1 hypothetical protein Pla52o_46990 [Novipirellula galeiformis]